MPPDAAKPFYASLVERFQKAYRADAVKGKIAFPSFSPNFVSTFSTVKATYRKDS